jgi:peptidoglycan/LPS O-acetylase OafA/YrhL
MEHGQRRLRPEIQALRAVAVVLVLLLLAACALVTLAGVPENFWRAFFEEIRAATLYVENWRLADLAVDYGALDNANSPVQH